MMLIYDSYPVNEQWENLPIFVHTCKSQQTSYLPVIVFEIIIIFLKSKSKDTVLNHWISYGWISIVIIWATPWHILQLNKMIFNIHVLLCWDHIICSQCNWQKLHTGILKYSEHMESIKKQLKSLQTGHTHTVK